jgi:hypothetical protein
VSIKRFSIILGLISATLGWVNAFAATPAIPSTACPTTFTCAFDAAEVRPLNDPTTPGAPAVYVGFLSFDGTGHPTLDALGDFNGTPQTLVTAVGTCTPGGPGTPSTLGTLDFGANGPKFAFVVDNSSTELRLIITADANGVTPSAVNIGTCTQQ